MEPIAKKLRSRKLWVTVSTAAALAFAEQLGIDQHTGEELVKMAIAYVLGQGAADTAKEYRRSRHENPEPQEPQAGIIETDV